MPDLVEYRLGRWALQSAARSLLPDFRVSSCLRFVVPGRDGVKVLYSAAVQRAHYGNLAVCGSVWACPICAAKISERRRVELAGAVDHHPEFTPALITFTVQHLHSDGLGPLVRDLLGAYRRLKCGEWWQNFRGDCGLVGSIRALEITHGVNGWHPHLHVLGFFRAGADLAGVGDSLKKKWGVVLGRYERTCTYLHGVDFRTADSDVVDYISKFGHEPVDFKRPGRWSMEHELTKGAVKRGRGDRGRGPLQLLCDYLVGDQEAGRLWVIFQKAFKGKRQLVWSRGLRELLGVGQEETDLQIAKREDEAASLLALLSLEQWRMVLGNDIRGELLEVASSGDYETLRAFLAGFGIELS